MAAFGSAFEFGGRGDGGTAADVACGLIAGTDVDIEVVGGGGGGACIDFLGRANLGEPIRP